ncbi:MAG: response regulator [Nitrospirae bacterium]|nr:MAG: response regulator [Nitrospirota bacterium]
MKSGTQRIILVEDSPTQAVKLCGLLEAEGFEVTSCSSAEEGLREIGKEPPDLLVVDYYLPGIRGDELCRRIRMDIEARQIPILMFTVDDTQAMEMRGLDAGADDYVSKSADPGVLIARIRGLLRKAKESQAILGVAQPRMRDVWMLAVDDSPTYLNKIVFELEKDGYKCERATSGEECLRKLAAQPFDCVILDLIMPEMDGIEVCRQIDERRRSLHRPLAVLMLTAQESKEDLTRALEAGADDFVGKSSDMTVLKGRIRALLRRNFYLEENRKIIEELKAKEIEVIRARIEKETAQARAALAQKLEVTNRELETANKELEAFSYSVSHDLRAPLRHLDGFSDLLRKHSAGDLDEKGNRYLRTISESAKQMGRLIDDLLEFSRTGRAELHSTTVSLDQLVKDALRDLKPDIESRCIAWAIGSLSEVYGDPSMLRQVLVNLIANAVKYTHTREQARIEIGSTAGHPNVNEVVVFVRDNGAGFDMQYAHKLFGVFQRLHSANEFEGTGIGLANVRRIIARHGGRTWAEGKVGEGATFYFSLPHAQKETSDD